jgi:NodT family efflux transporter outer membrane factor (OMF) lipoprotein
VPDAEARLTREFSRRELRPGGSSLAVRRAALALAMVAGGCTVGPDYEAPTADLNSDWLENARGGAEEPAATAAWWETFHDPTLNALVSSARSGNLSLRVAGLRVIEARAQRGIAVGDFYPQLQEIAGGLSANRVSENGTFPISDRNYAEASLGVQAAWELDFWGKFRRGIASEDASLLASVADYDSVLVSLTAEVATDYVLIRSLEERLVNTHANVTLQQETLRLTDTRFTLGAVSELDVATARGTLADTQALIPVLERALRQTKLALCVLLGRTPATLEAELVPATGLQAVVPEAPVALALGIPADLLRRRPDVRAAERNAAAQSERIGVAKADFFPSISVLGSTGFATTNVDRAGSPGLGELFSADSFLGFLGLEVHLPILNYGRISNNVRVQDARYEQAAATFQETVLRAAAEVESGVTAFLRAREQAGFLAQSVTAAQRSVELSLIQYRNGAVDFIRVNDAQTVLVTRQDTLVTARADVALGAIETYRALGGGWEVRGNGEFVDQKTIERMRARTGWGDVLAPDWHGGSDLLFSRPPAHDAVEPKQDAVEPKNE